jgi:hypothetical protein
MAKSNTNKLFEALDPYPWLRPVAPITEKEKKEKREEITGAMLANLGKAIVAIEHINTIPLNQKKPVLETLRQFATKLNQIVDDIIGRLGVTPEPSSTEVADMDVQNPGEPADEDLTQDDPGLEINPEDPIFKKG